MKPPEGYANFVKELSLHYFSNRQRIHIASLCTRVIKLQITDTAPFFDWWGKPHPLDTAIGGFRPRHLTTEINFVYHLHPRTDSDITGCKEVPEFHRPFYSNVTHLCLLARPGLYTSLYCAGLGKLPRLTHLAVEVFTPGPENIATYGVRVLRKHIAGILSDCKSLELLLIQVNSVDVLYEYNETKATIETLEDPRVVVIIRGLPTRRDTGVAIQKVWPYAEIHVKMRKWEGLKTPICVVSTATSSYVFQFPNILSSSDSYRSGQQRHSPNLLKLGTSGCRYLDASNKWSVAFYRQAILCGGNNRGTRDSGAVLKFIPKQ